MSSEVDLCTTHQSMGRQNTKERSSATSFVFHLIISTILNSSTHWDTPNGLIHSSYSSLHLSSYRSQWIKSVWESHVSVLQDLDTMWHIWSGMYIRASVNITTIKDATIQLALLTALFIWFWIFWWSRFQFGSVRKRQNSYSIAFQNSLFIFLINID